MYSSFKHCEHKGQRSDFLKSHGSVLQEIRSLMIIGCLIIATVNEIEVQVATPNSVQIVPQATEVRRVKQTLSIIQSYEDLWTMYIPPFSFLFASIFGFCKKWFQIGTSTKEFNRNEPLISNPTQPPASIASHLGQVLGWMEMSVAGAGPVDVGERWSLMEGASGF